MLPTAPHCSPLLQGPQAAAEKDTEVQSRPELETAHTQMCRRTLRPCLAHAGGPQPKPTIPGPEEKRKLLMDAKKPAGASPRWPADSGRGVGGNTDLSHGPHPLHPQVGTAASARAHCYGLSPRVQKRVSPMTPCTSHRRTPAATPQGNAGNSPTHKPARRVLLRSAQHPCSAWYINPQWRHYCPVSRRKFFEGLRVHSGARGMLGTR